MDAQNHHVDGKLKRKPADFTHIFSVSTIAPFYYCVMPVFSGICMTYKVHRFDARKNFWRMGYAIKKVHNILLYEAGQFYIKN